MKGIVAVLVLTISLHLVNAQWDPVDHALQQGVDTTAYPGCVALVGDAQVITQPNLCTRSSLKIIFNRVHSISKPLDHIHMEKQFL